MTENERILEALASDQEGFWISLWIIDACDGDMNAARMLARLLYWFKKGKDGEPRARVIQGGKRWIAKRHEDWWEECRLGEFQAKRAAKKLVTLGMADVDHFLFAGMRTAHYRLSADGIARAVGAKVLRPVSADLDPPVGADLDRPLTGDTTLGTTPERTVPNGTAQAANGAATRAPLAAHTNGSTQPEPLASPGLPSVAVNGASPTGAGEPPVLPAQPKRSARNGKASANGSTHAEPDSSRAAESKLVFGELCTWLGLDWTRLPANTRGRLNKTAAALLDAGLGAAAVARARDAWRFDWRAKGGQVPDLSQVEGLVARAGAGLTASETPGHYPRYGVHDAPARVKMSEVF